MEEIIELKGKYYRSRLRDKLHDYEAQIHDGIVFSINQAAINSGVKPDELLTEFNKSYEVYYCYTGHLDDHDNFDLLANRDELQISFCLSAIPYEVIFSLSAFGRRYGIAKEVHCVSDINGIRVNIICDYLPHIAYVELDTYKHDIYSFLDKKFD